MLASTRRALNFKRCSRKRSMAKLPLDPNTPTHLSATQEDLGTFSFLSHKSYPCPAVSSTLLTDQGRRGRRSRRVIFNFRMAPPSLSSYLFFLSKSALRVLWIICKIIKLIAFSVERFSPIRALVQDILESNRKRHK